MHNGDSRTKPTRKPSYIGNQVSDYDLVTIVVVFTTTIYGPANQKQLPTTRLRGGWGEPNHLQHDQNVNSFSVTFQQSLRINEEGR
jgi:hypothetical protein